MNESRHNTNLIVTVLSACVALMCGMPAAYGAPAKTAGANDQAQAGLSEVGGETRVAAVFEQTLSQSTGERSVDVLIRLRYGVLNGASATEFRAESHSLLSWRSRLKNRLELGQFGLGQLLTPSRVTAFGRYYSRPRHHDTVAGVSPFNLSSTAPPARTGLQALGENTKSLAVRRQFQTVTHLPRAGLV